jgi:hypothetical protein
MLRQAPADIATLADINPLMVGEDIAGGHGCVCDHDVFDHRHRESCDRDAARFVENFSYVSDAADWPMYEGRTRCLRGFGILKERHGVPGI